MSCITYKFRQRSTKKQLVQHVTTLARCVLLAVLSHTHTRTAQQAMAKHRIYYGWWCFPEGCSMLYKVACVVYNTKHSLSSRGTHLSSTSSSSSARLQHQALLEQWKYSLELYKLQQLIQALPGKAKAVHGLSRMLAYLGNQGAV